MSDLDNNGWFEQMNQPKAQEKDGIVADLTARLAVAEAERDLLLACRHGDQRCFECPDTKCCDNLNEAAKGGRE